MHTDNNEFKLISRTKVAARLGVMDYTVRDIEASDPTFPRGRRLVANKDRATFFYSQKAVDEWFAKNFGKTETA